MNSAVIVRLIYGYLHVLIFTLFKPIEVIIWKQKQVVGKLHVYTFQSREELGKHAAALAAAKIISLQQDPTRIVRIIFASAPSQTEFLIGLSNDIEIDWQRIEAFHMDEYIGLATDHIQSFGHFLKKSIFEKVSIGHVHFINGLADNPKEECRRYADLLRANKIDLVCMGIGENAHIAFNDPHVADFDDPYLVKIVDLDLKSRQQQVNDGCFPALEVVPTHAITLTVPALMEGGSLFCMVPGATKADAVYATVHSAIETDVPSSILRTHNDAKMFIDQQSGEKLTEE